MDDYRWSDAADWSPADNGDDGSLGDERPTVPYPHPWDWVETVLCRTVGCTGPFSRWFMWPVRYVCNPYMDWRGGKGQS